MHRHFELGLAYGNERDPLVLFVVHDARGVGVKHRLAVHNEMVLVMAVGQFDLGLPPAVHRAAHGKRTPVIEIAGEFN